jgi:carbon starvation protein CstA
VGHPAPGLTQNSAGVVDLGSAAHRPVALLLQKTNHYNSATMKKNAWRISIEVGFILFLFYTNLLMGEFEHSGMGQKRGLIWALWNIFTMSNFAIAVIAAGIGYVMVEFLRRRL